MNDDLFFPASWLPRSPLPEIENSLQLDHALQTTPITWRYGRLVHEPRRRRLALAFGHGEMRARDRLCAALERLCGRLAPWR